ncbi:hypothetical protein G6F56_011796 [Rhizopus delemar]|nr:hypothetical protein G6F56_011796 [Rhizopus delemar]
MEVLPLELQRNYRLIRQLDDGSQDLIKQVYRNTNQLLRKRKIITAEEKMKAVENIQNMLNDAIKKGEEKYALAKSTYDTIDRHCSRLDSDLQKIEDEQMVGSTRGVDKTTNSKRKLKGSNGSSQKGRKKRVKDDGYISDSLQSSISFSDMPIDPNEPRYCYCKSVSYGEMVACDNEECDIEWFHLECTRLKSAPKGSWFCRHCSPNNNKKKKKA